VGVGIESVNILLAYMSIKIIDINKRERECESVSLDKGYPGFVKVFYKSKLRKGYTHSEWYPVDEFLSLNPKFKSKIKSSKKPEEDLGIVSSAGKNYLKDIAKNWEKNVYVDFPLWISRGKGEGQQRIVIKNTKNILYIDKEWKEKPNKTSQYVLSRNINKKTKPLGNTLPDTITKDVVDSFIDKAKKGVKIKEKTKDSLN